ncbi:MAG: hypothetical protein ACI9UA_006109 [Pseudoalteromonas tetraodonis]
MIRSCGFKMFVSSGLARGMAMLALLRACQ